MTYPKKWAAIYKRKECVELENGRPKTLFRCECCGGLFLKSEIRAHHRNPVGSLLSTKQEDVEAYIKRMFCKTAEIQALCVDCHDKAHGSEEFKFESGMEFQ
jgi:hypothetical protein